MNLYNKILDTEKSKRWFQNYIREYYKNQDYPHIWEGIDYNLLPYQDYFGIQHELLNQNAINGEFFWFMNPSVHPSDNEVETIYISSKEQIKILLEDNVPTQDNYIFDCSLKWTFISCHEYLDAPSQEGKYEYGIIRR